MTMHIDDFLRVVAIGERQANALERIAAALEKHTPKDSPCDQTTSGVSAGTSETSTSATPTATPTASSGIATVQPSAPPPVEPDLWALAESLIDNHKAEGVNALEITLCRLVAHRAQGLLPEQRRCAELEAIIKEAIGLLGALYASSRISDSQAKSIKLFVDKHRAYLTPEQVGDIAFALLSQSDAATRHNGDST